MRKLGEIIRLKRGLGLTHRRVARSLKMSHSTVTDMLRRAEAAGLSWPLPEDLDDEALEARVYPLPCQASVQGRPHAAELAGDPPRAPSQGHPGSPEWI